MAIDAILTKKIPAKLVEDVAAVARGEKKYKESDERLLPLLFGMSEAARRLGVSRSRFWELRQRGVVPVVRVNGTAYIRNEDLERIVSELPAKAIGKGGGNE
jgi:hypothetical protein